MDKNETMVQVAIRVAQKLAEAGEKVTVDQVLQAMGLQEEAALPGLMILTKEHGCTCHKLYESSTIRARYQISCALEQEYQVELDGIEVLVLFQLTIEDMCKIASGMTDTPYTKLVAKALLTGKKIYVPREEVELYQYPVGGLGSYQCMLQAKLTNLVSFGLKICPMDQLEAAILGEAASEQPQEAAEVSCEEPEAAECACETVCEKEEAKEEPLTFEKRVITERDIIEANRDKVKVIRVTSKNILTPLAKDAASKRNIRLIRE